MLTAKRGFDLIRAILRLPVCNISEDEMFAHSTTQKIQSVAVRIWNFSYGKNKNGIICRDDEDGECLP